MSNRPHGLKVGFLGVGAIAKFHAEALLSLGHTVSAGCGKSLDSPRWNDFHSFAPQARFEADGNFLLNDPNIDAVVVCLPWDITELWLPHILSTPKPVLIEKPLALSSATLSGAMNQEGVILENKYAGFNRRFYSTVQALKSRMDQGGAKAATITISETVDRLAETYGDRIISHVLAYSSCHILDTATHILGPLKPIKIYRYDDPGYPSPFHSLTGLLETGSGIPVSLSIMADNPSPIGIRIFFNDRTTWDLSPMEKLTAYKDYQIIGATTENNIRRYVPKPFLEITEDSSSKPGFFNQMRAFIDGAGRHDSATINESLYLSRFTESIQVMASVIDTPETVGPFV